MASNPPANFYRDETRRGRWKLPAHNRFDMRDAAPPRIWRITPHQPGCERSRNGTRQEKTEEARGLLVMCACNQCIPQPVRALEGKPKHRSDKSEIAPTISAKTASTRRLPCSPSPPLGRSCSGVICVPN